MADEQNTKVKDGWIEAGGVQNEVWKPEKEGDTIEGVYVQKREGVGKHKSNVYLVQEQGRQEPRAVWGSIVLDARFGEIPEASQVEIEYLGEVQGKTGTYKDYRVLYKPPKEG